MAAGEPWIKFQKSLAQDPRIRKMARLLGERDRVAGLPETPFQRLWITCVGAVGILWITADSNIDQNDVLAIGPADIDQLTGVQGICDLMPREWLQVIDAGHVKLPAFQEHNGMLARKRAQAQVRQKRHRSTLLRDVSVTKA